MLAEQRGSWAPAPGGGFLLAGLARIEEGAAQFGMLDCDEVIAGGAMRVLSDDELDRIDPNVHGRERGQIDGTPEDGDSFFNVER